MAFQSAKFFMLLLGTLALYYIVPAKAKNLVLLAAGVIFYASAGPGYLALLAGAILLSYAGGLLLGRLQAGKGRRAVFIGALVLLFGNLAAFKYYDALCAALAKLPLFTSLPPLGLVAPLGISFYTFTMTGYLIDVYLDSQKPEKNLLRYAVFASFFPLILSGPIERGNTLLPQLDGPRKFVYDDFAEGASRMLWGFFKKFVVANMIGVVVDRVFADPELYSGPYLLMAALLYSYQIYCDFSGYSDIAIGVGMTLGIRVCENFARPFAARSFTEMWQRWHISLTSWFRDYVFMPLRFAWRDSRWPKVTGAIALSSIFLLSGLWHEAKMTYIAWGALNAVFMVIGKETMKKRRKLAKTNPLYKNKAVKAVLQIAMVYLMFTACHVFFRAASMSDAFYFYSHFATGWMDALRAPGTVVATLKELNIGRVFTLIVLGGGALVQLVEWRAQLAGRTTGAWMQGQKLWVRLPLYYAMLLALAFYGVMGSSSFIYFQF